MKVVAAGPDSLIWWEWVGGHRHDIWERTLEHVQLTLGAIGIGFLVSAALACLALGWRRTYAPITWATGLLYTIPSLALFTFLIPYTGLGFVTAEIGLVSYTLLILVRNIVAGIKAVPTAVTEAADGMGYTPMRRMLAVDVRLAMPTIIAGLRIASVTVVGLVTVTALVGAGGYGVLILDGLRRQFSTPIIVGTVLSVALALIIDLVLTVVGRMLSPWSNRAAR